MDALAGSVRPVITYAFFALFAAVKASAGVLESGEWHETDRGTPQEAGISPLLAEPLRPRPLGLNGVAATHAVAS